MLKFGICGILSLIISYTIALISSLVGIFGNLRFGIFGIYPAIISVTIFSISALVGIFGIVIPGNCKSGIIPSNVSLTYFFI